MRAVFGGAVAVVGVLFVVAGAISRPGPLLAGLALVFSALALGRLASLLADGWSLYTAAALAFEAVTAGVTAYLWSYPQALAPNVDAGRPSGPGASASA
jgi:hypothetical protein